MIFEKGILRSWPPVGQGLLFRLGKPSAPVSHTAAVITWAISAATIAAILLRPFAIGEWIWALAGAAIVMVGVTARNGL